MKYVVRISYLYSFVVEYNKQGIASSMPLIQMQAIMTREHVFDIRGRIGRTMAWYLNKEKTLLVKRN